MLAIVVLGLIHGSGALGQNAPNWPSWERENSVGQYGDFLVVLQPGQGYCYATQDFHDRPTAMIMTVGRETVSVIMPAIFGVTKAAYAIDGKDLRSIPASAIEGSAWKLPAELVPALRAGVTLTVSADYRNEGSRTQTLSLRGFTAAQKVINSSRCRDNGGGAGSKSLEVNLERDSHGGIVVTGETTLPNNMKLMISLRAIDGPEFYVTYTPAHVRSGSYRSIGYKNRGKTLPAGNYRVSFLSVLAGLQPASVKKALGQSGSNIPADIRGDWGTVEYSVTRTIK